MMLFLLLASLATSAPLATQAEPRATAGAADLPLLQVVADDTRITQSVRVRIAPGLVVRDTNGDGVLHVMADDVRVVFETGSVLRGASPAELPDSFSGIGVRVAGHRGVQLEGLRVRGFKAGVWATNADALKIFHADLSDNFTQRLASTPEHCDDGADWLACHDNDANEWLSRYGAGIYVEDSRDITVRDCRVRRTQNGILLDRVVGARVFDNDASFLSGWGLGLWRTTDSWISRNAFDFCIRGYSHGKYNRGQDSAGILVFEQCSRNRFTHNSATHGGDGVFGFAGSEALGQRTDLPEGFDATRRGNNDNHFVDNDFSYAAAHGLEMTFSFGNSVQQNSFVGNAICGIWGGYSQEMNIANNLFEANGGAGYGSERGGINIEHSVRNRITDNRFRNNACGVHLWWDADEGLLSTPWAKANNTGCSGNVILGNRFEGDNVGIELHACEPVALADNEMIDVGVEIKSEAEATTSALDRVAPDDLAWLAQAPGVNTPLGARAELAGRENILMGPWGPWDHESPFVQPMERSEDRHTFALHNFPSGVHVELDSDDLELTLSDRGHVPRLATIEAPGEGLFPYTLRVGEQLTQGLIQNIQWDVTTFAVPVDPREDDGGWRAARDGAPAGERRALDLPYASQGPVALGLPSAGSPGNDHFGTLASTTAALPAGEYELKSMSDDGVRVWLDGEILIDNWTWHAPTEDRATFQLDEAREVQLRVEHFELDGYATLRVTLTPQR